MRFSTTLIAITAVLGFAAASEKSPAPDRLVERSTRAITERTVDDLEDDEDDYE
ncbi:hypothetical protein PZA11_000141 [Diplocarpon coronariae]